MIENLPETTTEENISDEELVERLQAGDKAACAICIDRYWSRLYRVALRLMGTPADAEDVVQETFVTAYQKIDSFEGRSTLGTWLYRIVTNTALMRLRGKKPDFVSVEETQAESDRGRTLPEEMYDWCCLPEESFKSSEVQLLLEEAITTLPETLRTVFILREVEGMSTAATADTLEISTAAAKKRLQRARMQLREELSAYFVGQEVGA